jgi:hypothetical protein
METGKAKPLHYKRVIWLKDNQQPPESTQLIYSLLKDNTYTFKNLDIVLDVSELVDLRHTKTVYEYFEQLRRRDEDVKTLCIINYESDSLVARDILISRVTRMWTSYSTAYINYNNDYNISCNRSFNYIVGTDKLVERLSYIIQTGK